MVTLLRRVSPCTREVTPLRRVSPCTGRRRLLCAESLRVPGERQLLCAESLRVPGRMHLCADSYRVPGRMHLCADSCPATVGDAPLRRQLSGYRGCDTPMRRQLACYRGCYPDAQRASRLCTRAIPMRRELAGYARRVSCCLPVYIPPGYIPCPTSISPYITLGILPSMLRCCTARHGDAAQHRNTR